MTCELYRLRKELNELQKSIDKYEKRIEFYEGYMRNKTADVSNAGSEHDSIIESVEKMRAISDLCRKRRKEVD